MRTIHAILSVATGAILLSACGDGGAATAQKPAKVEAVAHESELMKITLTPAAERRLGIAVTGLTSAAGRETLETFGEVVIPPLSAGGLPVTATTDLATLATSQARADGDIARVAAQSRAADLNLQRAQALVREEAGSVKARDDAQAAALASRADLGVARRQRELLGASVDALGRQGTVWVRVPVLAGDVTRVNRSAPATIRIDGAGTAAGLAGRPVQAPPSANGTVGSVDLYFAVPNRGLRLGQRVAVSLQTAGPQTGGTAAAAPRSVPASAIVYDIHGGEWTYVRVGPHAYERRRVQVARIDGTAAMLARGLSDSDRVVTAGAAELFGTEFGTK